MTTLRVSRQVVIAFVVGVAVGGATLGIGALLGLGGGVILVPFLNVVLGLPFQVASGISLVTIIATSSASSDAPRMATSVRGARIDRVLVNA